MHKSSGHDKESDCLLAFGGKSKQLVVSDTYLSINSRKEHLRDEYSRHTNKSNKFHICMCNKYCKKIKTKQRGKKKVKNIL